MIEWTVATRPYPYPFGGGEHGLPESRRALAGTLDLGTAEWKRRGRTLNMRRALDTLDRNASPITGSSPSQAAVRRSSSTTASTAASSRCRAADA